MGKKYKAALIGCGRISPLHLTAIEQTELAELVAVCDIKEERAAKVAREYDCPYYTDYQEMLAKEDVEVVHIATPHYLHAPMTIEAARRGIHVLVEKPISISLADARQMIDAVSEHGVHLGVIFQTRFSKASQEIKRLIDSGELGKVQGVKASLTWRHLDDYYRASDWKGTWDKEGGGVVIDQAIHILDQTRWFVGEIARVKASMDTRINTDIEVEDTAEATIVFKNGVTGLFYASNCFSDNSPVHITIDCEKGKVFMEAAQVTINFLDGRTLHVEEGPDPIRRGMSYWGNAHPTQVADFYEAIATGRTCAVDGEEGYKTLELVQAIYRSARSGEWIEFPLQEEARQVS